MSEFILRFDVLEDGTAVRTEELDLDVIKVGKLSSSHLRLDDPNVSRIHAVVERASDGSFSVIDLGSATGTFVNGEKVTKSALEAGDELRFGDTLIRVDIVSATDKASQLDEAGVAAAGQPGAEVQTITLDDGTQVEPYTLQGHYDEAGNYIPGYYDEFGAYHLGYGYYDDSGAFQVSHGYYDPAGEWVDSATPVESVDSVFGADAPGVREDSWIFSGTRDTDVYQEAYFEDRGGETLEIAHLWEDHVLTVTSYSKPRTITVGSEEDDNDFVIEDPSLTELSFPLVSFQGGYALNFTERMTGTIQNGDETVTLRDAIASGMATPSAEASNAYTIVLSSRTSVRVDIGPSSFLVHFTDLPVLIAAGRGFDTSALPYFGLSAAAHILFLLLAMSMPDNARSLDLDGFQANDRFVQLMLEPEQEEEEEPDWLDDGGNEEAAAKHKGEEGKAGKEDEEVEDKKLAIKGDLDPEDLELKKARDTEVAMEAGIASELMVASPWGSADTSVGSDAIHALGNLTGDAAGNAKGFGGLGLSGAGRGGGGVSERGIGLANVGTAGRGGGGRGGSGYGKGAGDLGERRSRVPKIVPGKPAVQGSLDREIIRRVVRQHRREIKFCYEQELQKNKNLEGKVVVKFTISPTGSVAAASVASSTLNNGAVEQCMTSKIRRWVFPEPKGGGIVIVNYPFNLRS